MGADDPRLLTLARALAEVAHAGQSRKGNGEPYFNHLERVAKRAGVLGVRASVVGYLHDTLEDTRVSIETLRALEFPQEILLDVAALTRHFEWRPDFPLSTDPPPRTETYSQYIDRAISTGSDVALQVKLADLHDNMTSGYVPEVNPRYVAADQDVRAELDDRGVKPLVFS